MTRSSYAPRPLVRVRRRVFLSYYHQDELYRDLFEIQFAHLFINHSVKFGDIQTELSTEYIKRLIREGHISSASVVIVLVGPKTYCRKHVDWEIAAGLTKTIGGSGFSGLLGLCLPNHSSYGKPEYDTSVVPNRLVDNLLSGFAKLYDWTDNEGLLVSWVEEAFNRRDSHADLRDNRRLQFLRNRCD
jgi:hypothetical protein